jgi:hypothetical protein
VIYTATESATSFRPGSTHPNAIREKTVSHVSRILKAASENRPDALPVGLDKKPAVAEADLQRLIACWPRMPIHYKQTILTLVEVLESKLGKTQEGQ